MTETYSRTILESVDRVTGHADELLRRGDRPEVISLLSIALSLHGGHDGLVAAMLDVLAGRQLSDGNVTIQPDYPEAFWPTFWAAMAWSLSPRHHVQQELALSFILSVSGKHFEKDSKGIIGHDPSIRGWSWIAGTHC